MLTDTKPHIRRAFISLFCMGGTMWVCHSKYAYGYGNTPDEAYKSWKDDNPKSKFGIAMRAMFENTIGRLI